MPFRKAQRKHERRNDARIVTVPPFALVSYEFFPFGCPVIPKDNAFFMVRV